VNEVTRTSIDLTAVEGRPTPRAHVTVERTGETIPVVDGCPLVDGQPVAQSEVSNTEDVDHPPWTSVALLVRRFGSRRPYGRRNGKRRSMKRARHL
jgi:hypothetical protein